MTKQYGKLDLRNCDCMELMAQYPDKHFDLAIVDPPYGLKMSSGAHSNLKRLGNKSWDDNIPDQSYFSELFRVSKNYIIWGANYFNIPPCKCFLFWNKHPMPPSYAVGELAYTSFNSNANMWCGKTGNETPVDSRVHPTQKPIGLYKWILDIYAKEGDLILDTHLGSGSIAIACYYMGFDLIGSELDEDYYKAMMERIDKETAQQELF